MRNGNRAWSPVSKNVRTHNSKELFFPGQELDGNEIEVTLAKPVDKDHRQAKAAAKAVMSATTYPSFTPYEYPASTATYGFPAYSSQYFMYGTPMTAGMGYGLSLVYICKCAVCYHIADLCWVKTEKSGGN